MRNFRVVVLVLVFLFLQLFLLKRAQAEYRVYRLGVTYQNAQEYEVLSTLDNLQYSTYYPGQKVHIIDHWMCRGRTSDFAKYCSKPLVQKP